ncbi:MAG: sulfite exporter TauE/SafE family protein [Acidobacteria bacterium]|nr:sulfite exporter TauE/SafE family protein [Acidobacteriota bacterium]
MNLIAGLTAFFLGALHALEPGHGKSAIAAYAVGYRSNFPQIIVLGLSTAVAHTLTILILATLIGAAVSSFAQETTQIYVEAGSGLLLLATGLWLWRRALNKSGEKECRETVSKCSCHQEMSGEAEPVSFGVIGLLGISTGLLPCPTALAVLLSSMTAGHFFHGIWTVCLFSVGIALTMCAVACSAMLFARSAMADKLKLLSRKTNFASYLPILSSWVIILSAVFTLFRAFWHY